MAAAAAAAGVRRRLGPHNVVFALAGLMLLAESWRAVQAPQCSSAVREPALPRSLRSQQQDELGAAMAAAGAGAASSEDQGSSSTGSLLPPLPQSPQPQRFGTLYPQRLAAIAEACGLPPVPPLKIQRVKNIAVLGERHSGTNLVHQLMQGSVAGLELDYAGLKRHGHKHFFQSRPKNMDDPINDPVQQGFLIIVMVRNAYDWAERMYHKCYHCQERGKLSWTEFVTGEWNMTHVHDIHKVEERPFRNLFEMRGAKVCHWVLYAQSYGLPVEVVRHEDVMLPSQQIELVRRLREAYELQPLGENVSAGAFVESNLKAKKEVVFTIDSLEKSSVYMRPDLAMPQLLEHAAIVNSVLDSTIERALGYAPLPQQPRVAAVGSPVPPRKVAAAAAVAAAQQQR